MTRGQGQILPCPQYYRTCINKNGLQILCRTTTPKNILISHVYRQIKHEIILYTGINIDLALHVVFPIAGYH